MNGTHLVMSDIEKKYADRWKHYENKVGSILPDMGKYSPDFLVISPAKTSSTWLYENLIHHKDIYIKSKEMTYFSAFWQWYDINWYLGHFLGGEHKLKGDVSGTYSLLPVESIQYIKTIMPNLKIVLIIRHPVERTWSQIRHYYRFKVGPFKHFSGHLKEISLSRLLEEFWLESYYLWSDYPSIINRWLSCFSEENIYINYSDLIDNNPRKVLYDIFQFLGVDSSIDLSAFPVNMRILKGLDIDIPPEINEYFSLLFEDTIDKLGNVLRSRFNMSIPAKWELNDHKHKHFDLPSISGKLLPNRDVDHNSLPRFMECLSDHNIIFYEGLFHAISHRSGEVNLYTISEDEKRRLASTGDYLVHTSPEDLKSSIGKVCLA